jgi:hypothetical protein
MKLFLISALLLVFLSAKTVNAKDNDNWENYFDDVWKGDFLPMIEGNIGIAQPKRLDFSTSFSRLGFAELKLGYSEFSKYKNYVWQLDDRYLLTSYISPDLEFTNAPLKEGDVQIEATRFGLGNRLGYGYAVGPLALVPFNENSLVFTKLTFTHTDDILEDDLNTLFRYSGGYEFGMATGAGVKAKLFKSLSASTSYEWSVVYPVVIFPQWFGSFIIMHTGMSLISVFSQDIIRSSPLLGPMIYFALKNGLGYLFYMKMKENMHWPFGSEKPLTMESLRVGFSLTF